MEKKAKVNAKGGEGGGRDRFFFPAKLRLKVSVETFRFAGFFRLGLFHRVAASRRDLDRPRKPNIKLHRVVTNDVGQHNQRQCSRGDDDCDGEATFWQASNFSCVFPVKYQCLLTWSFRLGFDFSSLSSLIYFFIKI